jgi:integrase
MARHSKTGVRGLHRDADGRFRFDLRWKEPATGEWRRYGERFPDGMTAAAAKRRARELLDGALAGGFDPKREDPKRLDEALDEYEKWAETNRPRTARDRKSLAKVLRAALGDVRLDELSPFHVERLKRDRVASGAAPATANRAVAMLKHLCGLAAEWGWMPESTARAIRGVKLLREPPGRVRYLTDEETTKLLAAVPASIRPIVVAALLSGMRLGEVVGLRRDAVDLKARVITLTRTKSNRVRRVPVNDALAAVLWDAMRERAPTRGARKGAKPTAPPELVFTSSLGRPYTMRGVSAMFRRAVPKAGIRDLRFHDLRHDFATRLRRGGVGIDAIAALLGHASLAMAQRYAHIGMETLREAVAALAAPSTDAAVVETRSREARS